jgi:hypothetical protein
LKWLVVAAILLLLVAALWPFATRGFQQVQRLGYQWAGLAKLEPEQRSKICAHRANSLIRYRLANRLFHCIEIDVVVSPTVAERPSVYHPPDSNYRGLSLERLLRRGRLPAGALWLDVKDLGEANWRTLHSLLLELIPIDRRPDILIETGWADEAAALAVEGFHRSGFPVSYYLPTQEAIECGASESEDCMAFRMAVLRTLDLGFSHLSFDARGYEFVQAIRTELPESLRLLTWHTARSLPQMEMLDEVDLYIVTFRTPFDP